MLTNAAARRYAVEKAAFQSETSDGEVFKTQTLRNSKKWQELREHAI